MPQTTSRKSRYFTSWLTSRHLVPSLAGILLAFSASAIAQKYPSKPVNVIVGYAAGGIGDTIVRVFAAYMHAELGQPIIVFNRPGAETTIAMRALAKAEPDGYTIGWNFNVFAINTAFRTGLGYDSAKDFEPVALVATMPAVFVVHPQSKATTLREFIELARANPGKLTNGLAGTLSNGHLTLEMLKREAGFDVLNVAYKGGAPAITALMSGEVDMGLFAPSMLPYVRSGKLRALAVSSEKRLEDFPLVPTISETIPGFVTSDWGGYLAPAGIPKSSRDRLAASMKKASEDEKLRETLKKTGVTVDFQGPAEFSALLQKDFARFAELSKTLKITAN